MTRVHAGKLDERFDAGLGATTTRADALDLVRQAFMSAGLDTPDLDARLLLMKALQIDAVAIIAWPNLPLGSAGAARLAGFVRRRLAREPVGRILGQREFWGLPFELSPETLEPRPDTETVVETALSLMPDKQADLRILDLGTGSGCLLVALLHELPHAWGLGLDRSFSALTTARRNAARNGVADRAAFVMADWTAALRGRFDLVVSNPPYIASPDLPGLAPEVREHDPVAALNGGCDGLAAYRRIFEGVRDLLDFRGTLIVEIGSKQERAVRNLAVAAGLKVVRVAPDLGGHPRGIAMTPSYFEAELVLRRNLPFRPERLFNENSRNCLLRALKPANLAQEIVNVRKIRRSSGLHNTPAAGQERYSRATGGRSRSGAVTLNPTRKDDLGR